jgi:hypothetical protein
MVMQRHQMWRTNSARRLGGLAAVAIAAAVCVPLAASASPHRDGSYARSAATTGVVYGGRTAQGWPVMIELKSNRRRVVQAVIGLRLPCTSGNIAALPDRYVNLAVNKRRKFRASFGPDTVRNDDGTTSDFEGSVSGRLNRARSKVSGRWQLKITEHDSAGAVTDTCDSGSISWTAKQ